MPRRKSMMRVSLEDGQAIRKRAIAAGESAGFAVVWERDDLTIMKRGVKELRISASEANLRCSTTDACFLFATRGLDTFAMAAAWQNAVEDARAADDDFAPLPKAAFARLYHRFTVNLALQGGDSATAQPPDDHEDSL